MIPDMGFLQSPPVQALPPGWEAWTALLAQPALRDPAALLALPGPPMPSDPGEQEYAFLVCGLLAHAWVVLQPGIRYLPPALARPWAALARLLDRPPMMAHGSYVLRNWRVLQPGSADPDAFAPLHTFTGTRDEDWFILVTVAVEAEGTEALSQALEARLAPPEQALPHLEALGHAVQRMTDALGRMEEACGPEYFYHHIRPYLTSFQDMEYQGAGGEPLRSYAGGSAAQSTLIQALDALLGVQHPQEAHRGFLLEMRRYMPPAHRQLLLAMEALPGPGAAAAPAARSRCIEALGAFRQAHLRIAAAYIFGPAARSGGSSLGTGGTHPMHFLKDLRRNTRPD